MATTDHIPIPVLTARQKFNLYQKIQTRGETECWPWFGYLNTRGYPSVHLGRPMKATRVVFKLAYGKDPGMLCVLHACDNRTCCNPAHMFLGTAADNTLDMMKKGRDKRSKLSPIEVEQIRAIEGLSNSEIGRRFGVGGGTIGRLRGGFTWKHL